jgi:hypothetical protein
MVSRTQGTLVITTSIMMVALKDKPTTVTDREALTMEIIMEQDDQTRVTWAQTILVMMILATLGLMMAFLIMVIKAMV